MERYRSELKRIRKEAGLTVSELAVGSGVGERTIVSIENKEGSNPSVGTVLRLLSYLQISFEDLKFAETADNADETTDEL